MKKVVYKGHADRLKVSDDLYLYKNEAVELNEVLAKTALNHRMVEELIEESDPVPAYEGGEE